MSLFTREPYQTCSCPCLTPTPGPLSFLQTGGEFTGYPHRRGTLRPWELGVNYSATEHVGAGLSAPCPPWSGGSRQPPGVWKEGLELHVLATRSSTEPLAAAASSQARSALF